MCFLETKKDKVCDLSDTPPPHIHYSSSSSLALSPSLLLLLVRGRGGVLFLTLVGCPDAGLSSPKSKTRETQKITITCNKRGTTHKTDTTDNKKHCLALDAPLKLRNTHPQTTTHQLLHAGWRRFIEERYFNFFA
jgi:hypothetical protein